MMTQSPNTPSETDLSKRTPQEVFEHHTQAVNAEDLDAIMKNYAEMAYIVTSSGVLRGKDALRGFFVSFFQAHPRAKWGRKTTFVDNLLFLEWTTDSGVGGVAKGVDIFIFQDGLIQSQTTQGTVQSTVVSKTQLKFQFKVWGILEVVPILAMFVFFGIAFLLRWNINLWYFIVAIAIYSLAIVIIVWNQEYYQQQSQPQPHSQPQPQSQQQEQKLILFNLWRIKVGCHLALLLWIVTLGVVSLLPSNNAQIIFGFFVASVAGGMVIPFMLLKSKT